MASELEDIAGIEFENRRVIIDEPAFPDDFMASCASCLRDAMAKGSLFVCLDEKGVAGHYFYSVSPSGSEVSLDSVQVAKRRQRQGLGAILVDNFLSRMAQSCSPLKIKISIHPSSPGVQLYLSRKFSIEDNSPAKLILSLTLPGKKAGAS